MWEQCCNQKGESGKIYRGSQKMQHIQGIARSSYGSYIKEEGRNDEADEDGIRPIMKYYVNYTGNIILKI